MSRLHRAVAATAAVVVASLASSTRASFTTFSGDAAAEATWQAAAGGSVPIEKFESFNGTPNTSPTGDPIISLPTLHVRFDGPPYPGAYNDANFAHSGVEQWSNFGAGAGNSSSHTMRVEPGYAIYALGFWNCDPQGAQPMNAYDFNGQLVGTIVGAINSHPSDPTHSTSFAGFVSTVPIQYLAIPGALGDGWNHFDDLQIRTTPIPEPGTGLLVMLAIAALVMKIHRRGCEL